jgi:DNA modification methylase
MTTQRIIAGDCLEGLRTLPDASVHCCVTSPPYWGLRDYGHDGQIGLEATPEAYVARMVEVFREVRRVLRDDGTCWVNLGDSYAGGGGFAPDAPCNVARREMIAEGDCKQGAFNLSQRQHTRNKSGGIKPQGAIKAKDLVGIPWRVAFALQADGWWLRQDIIWHKPNPMPESVRDRCTKAHEYVFLLTKSQRYYYDAEAVSEAAAQSSGWAKQRAKGEDTWKYGRAAGGDPNSTNGVGGTLALGATRNRRSVWTVTTKPYSGAHFAVMPPDLVEPCIKAGCPEQCCSVCGKGWGRVVEREKRFESGSGRSGNAIEGKQDLAASETNSTPDIRMGPVVSVQTLGFAPACDCAATGTIPGTVLDPFAGSGTTLAVAVELGRSGIGCELNPEYIELAEQRIAKARAKVALFA